MILRTLTKCLYNGIKNTDKVVFKRIKERRKYCAFSELLICQIIFSVASYIYFVLNNYTVGRDNYSFAQQHYFHPPEVMGAERLHKGRLI